MVDASALVAMATEEDDARAIAAEVLLHADRSCCAIGLWEAARAVARKRKVTASEAGQVIDDLRTAFRLRIVEVGEGEARLALQAHDRYGKGTHHPARLNMGDCFAYACAKAMGAKLLYKGDDFARTDLA